MLVFVIISVFIAGLMVGRTPEYLGKKIEAYDVQLSMLYLLIFPLIILGFSGYFGSGAELWPVRSGEPGTSRALRNPVRLYIRYRKQWIGVWRLDAKHAGTT